MTRATVRRLGAAGLALRLPGRPSRAGRRRRCAEVARSRGPDDDHRGWHVATYTIKLDRRARTMTPRSTVDAAPGGGTSAWRHLRSRSQTLTVPAGATSVNFSVQATQEHDRRTERAVHGHAVRSGARDDRDGLGDDEHRRRRHAGAVDQQRRLRSMKATRQPSRSASPAGATSGHRELPDREWNGSGTWRLHRQGSTPLTFAARRGLEDGTVRRSIETPALDEVDETFTVTLSEPRATPRSQTAPGRPRITDDDAEVSVGIDQQRHGHRGEHRNGRRDDHRHALRARAGRR